jgi:hypothetical protein
VTDNRETAWVNFIQSTLWRVPIGIPNIEVDDVARSDTSLNERKMVIATNGIIFIDKHIGIAESCGGCPDQVNKPRRGTRIALDSEIYGNGLLGWSTTIC